MNRIYVFLVLLFPIFLSAHILSEEQVLTTTSEEFSQIETSKLNVLLTPDFNNDVSHLTIENKNNSEKTSVELSPYFRYDRTTLVKANTINICPNVGYYAVLAVDLIGQEAFLFEREEGTYYSLFLFNSKLDLVGQIDNISIEKLDIYYLSKKEEISCHFEEVAQN